MKTRARMGPTDFWLRVQREPGPCWQWNGFVTPGGYGDWIVAHQHRLAHRYAYELLVGPIPDGLQLDHLCRNRACVNPAHLEPVTAAENMRRRSAAIVACTHGHPYTDETLYVDPRGKRGCRPCRTEQSRAFRARRTEGVPL